MRTHFLRLALISALLVSLAAFAPVALAQEHGGEGDGGEAPGGTSFIGGPNWDDAKDVTIWSIVSLAGGSALLGVLYLFKRKVGGFPENPSWVAPITIMPASQLPGDDGAADHAHDAHAPAH